MSTINLAQKSMNGYAVATPQPSETSYPCVYIQEVPNMPTAKAGDSVVLMGKIKEITESEDKDGKKTRLQVEVHEMDHKGGKEKEDKQDNGNKFGQKRKDELEIDKALKSSEKKMEKNSKDNNYKEKK